MRLNPINEKYFRIVNPKTKGTQVDISCKCHICGDSKTGRKTRLHLFTKDGNSDSVHCFNCGYSSSAYNYFKTFHSDVFSMYKNELRAESFNSLKKKEIDLNEINDANNSNDANDKRKAKTKKDKLLTLDEFNDLTLNLLPTHREYLENRNFSKDDIARMYARSGKETNIFNKELNLNDFIVIPLLDENFMVFGYQARCVSEKKFFSVFRNGHKKLWGLHTLKDAKTIYAFESIFDAISSGFENTLAVLGISSSDELLKSYKKNLVIFFDNQNKDKASLEMCKALSKKSYNIVVWSKDLKHKDVNDLRLLNTQDRIQAYARQNTYNGLESFLRLSLINI